MPYTNPWSNIIPSGGAQAITIDDQIRQLRLDIQERMDTILATGGKWTNDPIALPSFSGQVNDRHIIIPALAIQHVNDEDNTRWEWGGHGIFKAQDAGLVSVCPLQLPIGIVITRFEFISQLFGSGTSLSVKLYKRAFNTSDAVTQIGSTLVNNLSGAEQLTDSGAGSLSETVDESTYWIENQPSGAFSTYWMYGYRLTVNVPGANFVV